MKATKPIITLLACALCAGTAEANGHSSYGKTPVDQFRKLDKNHDGTLSPQEFAAGGKGYTAAKFAALDKNHDGKLDRYEFSLMNKKHKR